MSGTQPRTREEIENLILLDMSEDARDAARDQADARLSHELNSGGRMQRIGKSIWKGGIAKEYFRQKYIRQAHTEIEQSQDVLIHEVNDRQAREMAMVATIERFQSEYDEAIHEDAGEQREALSQDSEVNLAVKDLIGQYAGGHLDDESLNEEFARVVGAYRDSGANDLKGAGVVQLSNMLSVARQVRSAVEHGESLDAVMQEFSVISGEARTGVRTAAKYDKVEKAIDKIHSTRLGAIVGPEVVTAGVSIAASVLRFGSEKAMYAAAKTVSLGVGAGVLSGLRERKRVKDERVQHSREMAQGKEIIQGSKRREEMETTRYETVEASDLRQELLDLTDHNTLEGGGADALQAALDALARAETFVQLSDQRNIDLISYSDVANVSEERYELDIARAEAKVELRHRLDDAMRQQLGFMNGEDVSDIIEAHAAAFIDTIDEDISEKDRAFNRLRRRRVLGAAARGAATGLVFGAVAQEAFASLSDTRAGVVEKLWDADNQAHSDGMQHNTLINGFFEGDENHNTIHHDPSSEYSKYEFGEHGEIRLPEDYTLINNGDGTVSIIDPNGDPSISSLSINEDGSLPKESRQLLRSNGMEIDNLTKVFDKTRLMSVDDYLGSKHDTTTHVTRELWYDNNTPKPVFDENELGMSWGGDGNTGITANGDYSFDISGMQGDGSYHGSESANWSKEAGDGALKLAVSASKDSQAHVFMLDIDANGQVIIPKGSPAGALFTNENGHAVFKGAYAETVQVTGTENGVTSIRPLATVVGENNPGDIPVVTEVRQPGYRITPSGYDTVTETPNFTEMAPVIPVDARRTMEAVRRKNMPPPPYYGEYGTAQELSRTLDGLDRYGSPRLLGNPDADLKAGEELEWYKQGLRQQRGGGYVDTIDQVISGSPELSSVSNNLESIVTIPVKASGQEEADGIYDLLRVYAQQDQEALAKNLMILHVNWPKKATSNPEDAARIQRTKDEIERAKADFPALKIGAIESEWTDEELEGGVIGLVGERLRDVALLTVQRAITEGRMSDSHDVQIIRNDADARGLHKNYLSSYQKAFAENEATDIYTGTTRFDERRATDLPGMVLGQHFAQTINILQSSRQGVVHTGGANFAVRASTLAAITPVLNQEAWKGVGSDDVAVGRVVAAARNRNPNYSTISGLRQSRLGGGRGLGGTAYYSVASPLTNSRRKIAKRVVGAQIDTDSQRSEEVYLLGGVFHNTWDNFDEGGHRERGLGLNDPQLIKRREELKSNLTEQIKILEKDIQLTVSIAGGVKSPVVRTALEMMFSGLKAGTGYKVRGGTVELTAEGKRYLGNRFERDQRGRFDQFGSRLARQIYGQVKTGSKRTKTNAPLLSVS